MVKKDVINIYDEKSLLAQTLIAGEILREVQLNVNNNDLSVKQLVLKLQHQIQRNGEKKITIYSPGFILSQFYIVFILLGNHRREIPNKELLMKDYFHIKKNAYRGSSAYEKVTVNEFLRRLRNSIAHFNVKISSNYDVIFTDKNPRDVSDFFQLSLSSEQTQNLYSELLQLLVEIVIKT